MTRLRTSLVLLLCGLALAAPALAQTTTPTFVVRVQLADQVAEIGDNGTVTVPADGIGVPNFAGLTFINRSTSQITVNVWSLTGSTNFSITGVPEAPITLNAGGTFGGVVRYDPRSSGQVTARFFFSYRIGTSTTSTQFTVNLVGIAPEFVYNYTPQGGNATQLPNGGTIQFPDTALNATSTATVVITNRGSGTGAIQSITGSGPQFQLISLPLPGTKIDAGKEVKFTINFSPTQLDPVQGGLTVNSPAGPAAFVLRGAGTGPAYLYHVVDPGGAYPVQPNQAITLPDIPVGEKSTLVVQVRNGGNADGKISTISVSGAGFALSELPFLPVTLTPGNGFSFTVNFNPTTPGRVFGRLRIGDDNFDLSGSGLGPTLTYAFIIGGVSTPVQNNGSVIFTPAAVGTSSSLLFQLTNTGTGPATVNSIGITTTTTVFTLGQLPPLPFLLDAGASATFQITFAPTALGVATSTLKVDTQTFTLSGTGTSPTPLSDLRFDGASGAQQPLQQPVVGLTLAAPYPLPLVGTLTLAFNSDVFSNDPAVQFANGSRTVDFTIPANTTRAIFPGSITQVRVQTGSVAGSITLTPSISTEGGINLTPTNPPQALLSVAPARPVILSVVISQKTQTALTLQISGYTTARSVTQMELQFTPVAGENVSTTRLSIPAESSFLAWYRSTQSAPFGSLFTATVPLSFQGDVKDAATVVETVQSISVTLANSLGTSPALSVNVR